MDSKRNRRMNRRGNALYSVVVMFGLVGFAALVVDVGSVRAARAELQSAADAGTHAGVSYLDGTTDGCAASLKAALALANANRVAGTAGRFTERDVRFGVHAQGTLTLGTACTAMTNTLQIDKSIGGLSTLFAGAAFGQTEMGARAVSTTKKPPGTAATSVACYLPVAVPQCAITGNGVFQFRRSSNSQDTAGWASMSSSANASFFKDQLSGYACGGASVNAPVSVQNGSVTAAEAVAVDRINGQSSSTGVSLAAADVWPADIWSPPTSSERLSGSKIWNSTYGKSSIAGPVLLVKYGDLNGNGVDDLCDPSPPNYNGTMTLAGFAYGALYDVNTTDIAILVNTDVDFYDGVTSGSGTNPYGMLHEEPAVFLN